MMYENIVATIFGDEAKSLCIIKPFNCSFYHFTTPFVWGSSGEPFIILPT